MDAKAIKSYRDLIVWQKAHALGKKVIEICSRFPNIEEARIIGASFVPGTLYEIARFNLKQRVDIHELDTENTKMF